MRCAFLGGIRPIRAGIFTSLGRSLGQVTATKLAWTHGRTSVNFLLFSGEICRALITES
jgi:hypothetical protein